MECDIDSNSVTFYDYGQYSVSTGYYAIVTSVGDIVAHSKNIVYGAYSSPADNEGTEFLGWSTNRDAFVPAYVDESSFIADAQYTNTYGTVTLYAVWKGSFDKVYSRANKDQYKGYYKMQDMDTDICNRIKINAKGRLIDVRDDETYAVAKLADDKCWMAENLNLAGGTALSVEDTDYDSSYTLPTTGGWSVIDNKLVLPSSAIKNIGDNNLTDDTQFRSYDTAYVFNSNNKEKCGFSGQDVPCYSYYSWDVATIGSGRNSDSVVDALYSICPKGWRLPTSGTTLNDDCKRGDYYNLAKAYDVNLSSYSINDSSFYDDVGPGTIANFTIGGRYGYGIFSMGGRVAYYHSSTDDDVGGTRVFSLSNNNLDTSVSNYFYKHYGGSVRCIANY